MYGINLFSTFSKPTRTTSTSARLIDKGLINDISDHLSVFCNYILHKMTFVINDQVSKLIYFVLFVAYTKSVGSAIQWKQNQILYNDALTLTSCHQM